MKIYDCFMYYDEDQLLDLRLNILNEYVDKFVITESKFTHSGEKRNLLFNICYHNRICIKLNRLQYVAVEMVDEIFNKHMDSFNHCHGWCRIKSL